MGTIATAKAAMGWQSANQRPACCRCDHAGERGMPSATPTWYCIKGGFLTTGQAVCNEFKPRVRHG